MRELKVGRGLEEIAQDRERLRLLVAKVKIQRRLMSCLQRK